MRTVAVAETTFGGSQDCRGCGGGDRGRSPDRFRDRHSVALTVEERPGSLVKSGTKGLQRFLSAICAFHKTRG